MAVSNRLVAQGPPASTLMIIWGFTRPEFKVEVEAIAFHRRWKSKMTRARPRSAFDLNITGYIFIGAAPRELLRAKQQGPIGSWCLPVPQERIFHNGVDMRTAPHRSEYSTA